MAKKKKIDDWTAGYLCAVATLARHQGSGSSFVDELLREIDLPKVGDIEEMDRNVLIDFGYLKEGKE